jgi:hypothetical protein
MPPRVIQVLTIVLSLLCIAGFAAIYGIELYHAFEKERCPHAQITTAGDKTMGQPDDIKDPYSYVATALSTLVGGVVTIIFGQSPPQTLADIKWWKALIQTIYTGVYFIYGIAGVVAWVGSPTFCPSILVKTLALTFLGLVIPIVGAFLRNASLTHVLGWSPQ